MKRNYRRICLFLNGLFLTTWLSGAHADEKPKYQDPSAPVEDRVNDLMARMTLDEKVNMVTQTVYQPGTILCTNPNKRLGIPAVVGADGRMGVRGGELDKFGYPNIAYPAGLALSASWDSDLAAKFGESLARDAHARGVGNWLGPMVDMYRTPVGGRNFECGGEDPYLVSRLAVSEVNALQAGGVMATAVIFCCNDQDFGKTKKLTRYTADSIVDERTLREIYFPPFKALAQEAHVGTFMASYNLLNGEHCTQNHHLLTDILKNEWGFQGYIMSDWTATHDTVAAANAGLDLEMPPKYFIPKLLLPAIQSGKVKEAVVDDKVRRILREFFTFGFFDRPQTDPSIPLDDPKSDAMALDMAREEMVLLKNQDNLLPLDPNKIHSVVVLGPNADPAVWSGSGSSFIPTPTRLISVLGGVKEEAGFSVQVTTVPWNQWRIALTPPASPARPLNDLIADSVKAAKQADVAVICVGFKGVRPHDVGANFAAKEGEGSDRIYTLPPGQVQLIQAVVAANPHTVVILNSAGAVDWSGWLDRVPVLIDAWYPGQEGGRALAEILFGKVNPSGKLPITLEKKWEDNPSSKYYDQALANTTDTKVIYGEGIFTGYRGFDQSGIEPQFPFGYGLSYTTFAYGNPHIDQEGDSQNPKVTVHFEVKNTGTVAGAEIAEVYVGDPHASVPRPPKELKGFSRVQLAPGETKTIDIALDRSAFTFYDVAGKDWKLEPGEFTILVGSSSRDIRLKQTIKL